MARLQKSDWNYNGDNDVYADYGHTNYYLIGADGKDKLFGNDGADYLSGGSGNDQMWGGAGDDEIWGHAGDDVIYIDRGNNIYHGGSDRDTLKFYDVTTYASNVLGVLFWSNEIKEFNQGFSLDVESGETRAQQITSSGLTESYDDVWGTSTFTSIEEIWMTNQNDIVRDNDVSHEIHGRGGDDLIEGRGGADFIRGGSGVDTASYASAGSLVKVNLLANTGQFNDAAGDTFESIENLIGSFDFDLLTGDHHNNRIEGRGGGDEITGNRGADTLLGGAGYDFFDYNALSESTVAPGGRDTILDFEHGIDRIDLGGIDAQVSGSGIDSYVSGLSDRANDAFTFIGTQSFSGSSGQLRYSVETDRAGAQFNRVEGDVNGDRAADFAIAVYSNGQAFGQFDFYL